MKKRILKKRMKSLKYEDEIMKMILEKYHQSESGIIMIYRNDIVNNGFDEKEAAKMVSVLESSDFFTISRKSSRNDFSIPWTLQMKISGVNYFVDRKTTKTAIFQSRLAIFISIVIPILIKMIDIIYNIYK